MVRGLAPAPSEQVDPIAMTRRHGPRDALWRVVRTILLSLFLVGCAATSSPSSPSSTSTTDDELNASLVLLGTYEAIDGKERVIFREPTTKIAEGTSDEVVLDGTRFRRLPCSETMYQEQDRAHACAYYQCKLDRAPTPAEKCPYFRDYGLPYCQKFYDTKFEDPKFGPFVRQCLQEAIRDRMEESSCDEVHTAAHASHVECYVEGGFCTLSLADKLALLKTIEAKDRNLTNGVTFAKIEKACLTR